MILADEFEAIDSHLRFSTSIDAVLPVGDKEIILCANYAKGHGELSHDWIDHNKPGSISLHVDQESGSRQDLLFEGASKIF